MQPGIQRDRFTSVTVLTLACLAVLAFVAGRPAQGQILYGSLVGKMTDPSGAAIVAAKVAIRNKATNLSREALTDSFGSYDFPNLPTGNYDVNASAPGFSTFVRTDVPVSINNITRIEMAL